MFGGVNTMLKQVFKTYGRHRPDELITALLALSPAELVGGIVKLFAAGELRFITKRRVQTARKLCARFYRYHKQNPNVAEWFVQAAQSLQKEQHRTRYAIGALTERIRWDIRMGVIKTEGFRISNDIRACYARLVLMRDPSLCGIFALKPSIGDDLLTVDGRSWSEFAKEHHAELWPERKKEQLRKPPMFVHVESKLERQG
jgi:hypothetical protein